MLVDATHGRRTRAVIVTDSGHIILTYLQAETVEKRMNDETGIMPYDEDEEE